METLWILTELFLPDETSTAYIMGELADAFSKKYNVKVICGPEYYDKKKQTNTKFSDEKKNYEVFRVKTSPFNKYSKLGKGLSLLWMSFSLYRFAKRHIKNGDKVLMVTNPAPLVVLIGYLKKKINFHLNILVHDIFPENAKSANIKIPAYSFLKQIFDKAYSKADQLIAIGRDMKDILKGKVAKYNANIVINVIENWADTNSIACSPINSKTPILQYAGNIGRVQGLDKIISQLPEGIEFHIYGSGAMEEKLKAMNHDRVFFHGPYMRSQQNDILSDCSAALVTLEDGMYGLGVPSKTYNILASGRPIIYFGPSNSEVELLINEYKIGYCGWPEKWDKDVFFDMGKKARILAENKFEKKVIIKKFLEVI